MKLKSIKRVDQREPNFIDVKQWYERNMHPDVLDLNDEKVFKHVYHSARWAGIFQFTARGAQQFAARAKPNNVTDIATLTSIYRPGPLAAEVDKLYVEAKLDPESVKYEHPLVKQVLEPTVGCVIFQEQIMQVANVIGGLSLDECDKLRKVITKRSMSGKSKAKEEALKLEKKFIDGAISKGVSESVAKGLFEKLAYFSGYGFNKSLDENELIPIYTHDGKFIRLTTINGVKSGDFVKSRNELTGDVTFVKVVALHDHGMLELFEFTLDDGKKVTCTPNHKFRVTDGRMLPIWQIAAEELDIVVDTVTEA